MLVLFLGVAALGINSLLNMPRGEDPEFTAPQFAVVVVYPGTDDLDMEALSGSVPDRARVSLAAGCDIALNCWAKMDDMVGIADCLPAMSDATRARLDRAHEGMGREQRSGAQADLIAKRDALLEAAGVRA